MSEQKQKSKKSIIQPPSKYKEEYCQMLTEHMAKGLSFESFAAIIHVHRDTLYEWNNKFSEFAEAKRVGTDKNLLFWEQKGIEGMCGMIEDFNATAFVFNMKNRHKWRDKQPDENDVVVNNNNIQSLSDAEIDRRIEESIKLLTSKK